MNWYYLTEENEVVGPVSEEALRTMQESGVLSPGDVLDMVDRYRACIAERFQPTLEKIEVPFAYQNDAGQRLGGFIDHLVETENGLVILDHKIFPGKRKFQEEKALSYSGQLAAYRGALPAPDEVRTIIHLVSAGTLIEVAC